MASHPQNIRCPQIRVLENYSENIKTNVVDIQTIMLHMKSNIKIDFFKVG